MQYLSCFSGIGGLEGTTSPIAVCELDETCRTILQKRFPHAVQFDDIRTIAPPKAEVVVGGWPCQDLSVAGKQRGLEGPNSGLFYSFVKAAKLAAANTVIAENVPNLLKMQNGLVFKEVLNEFNNNGYNFCAWRTINARQFGLPHHRNRVFIIASNDPDKAMSLFRPIEEISTKSEKNAAGFYWTAGSQSICYSEGYVPTIKVGSGLSIASPPAVYYDDIVRQLSPSEALQLQGFNPSEFNGLNATSIYKMAGNAVARPVGLFVVDGVLNGYRSNISDVEFILQQGDLFGTSSLEQGMPSAGFSDRGTIKFIKNKRHYHLARNLSDFLDYSITSRLSQRAATGLLGRLERSGHDCPNNLRIALTNIANGAEDDAAP